MTKIHNGSALALANLRRAKTKNEIMEILANLTITIGANQFQIIPAPNCPLPYPNRLLEFGNFNENHKNFYINETSALIDPCRYEALNNSSTIRWRKVFLNVKGKMERDFISKLREWGIKDGISIPIHGPNGPMAIFNFASIYILELSPDDEEFLQLIAILALQRIKQFWAKECVNKGKITNLTMREIECLTWVLEGKTNWEIGVLMGVSARTVQFHIGNCQAKLNANNRIQAAVRALMQGQIFPSNDFMDIENMKIYEENYINKICLKHKIEHIEKKPNLFTTL